MQHQADTKAARPSRRSRRTPEFIAAVRFHDGRRELFAVKNALDLADARALVLSELLDATAVVIAPRH